MSTQMVNLRIIKTLCVSYCTCFIKLLRLLANTLHTCAHKDVQSEPWIHLLAATWVVTLIQLVFVRIKIHTFSDHMVRQLRRKIPYMCSVCVPCVFLTWSQSALTAGVFTWQAQRKRNHLRIKCGAIVKLHPYSHQRLIVSPFTNRLFTEKHHQYILCHYVTSHLTILGYLVHYGNSKDSGHFRKDGRSLLNNLNQPPGFVLWHLSQPLPVPGKLPACSPFHQEPQEMSLGERWSLIKNKWMGCPRDRVNEEWELEGELEPVPQSGGQGRAEPGNGKTKF